MGSAQPEVTPQKPLPENWRDLDNLAPFSWTKTMPNTKKDLTVLENGISEKEVPGAQGSASGHVGLEVNDEVNLAIKYTDTSSDRQEKHDAETHKCNGNSVNPQDDKDHICAVDAISPVDFEITIFRNANERSISKHIAINADGKIVSDGSHCAMSRGSAERRTFRSLSDFAALVSHLPPHKALSLGRLRSDIGQSAQLVSEEKLSGSPDGTISRTQTYLGFRPGSPAIMLLDFDQKAMTAANRDRLEELGGFLGAIGHIIPDFDRVGHVIRKSTSAGLFNADTGHEFGDSGGLHLYVPVADGSDITRALAVLQERAWLAGLGWIYVSAAASLLVRSIVDVAVGTPERLVFEGAPTLEPPLKQHPRLAVATEGALLDTRDALPDLTDEEKREFERVLSEAKRAAKPQADRVRDEAIEKAVEEAVTRGIPEARAREAAIKTYSRNDNRILYPSQALLFDDPKVGQVSCADILANPKEYVGKTLADPLEVYDPQGRVMRNRAVVVIGDLHGDVMIYSQLHGGIRYILRHDETSIIVAIEKFDKGVAEIVPAFISMMLMGGVESPVSESAESALIDKIAKRRGCGKMAVKRELREARVARGGHDTPDVRATVSNDNGDISNRHLIDPNDHTTNAQIFLRDYYVDETGQHTIFFNSSTYYNFNGRIYEPRDEKDSMTDGQLWLFLRNDCLAQKTDKHGNVTEELVLPTNEMRANLRSGFKSLIQRDMPADPSWLDGRRDPDLRMLLPVKNGLLNLRTRELLPSSAKFFTLAGVSYPYDPDATCPAWDQFMTSILGDDRDAINLIEEMYGYFLTTDTRYHKIFAMYGPPRSGRGTILRVMDALTESVVSVPFRQLDDTFAFQSVIGKKVLAIPDLRVGRNVDVQAVNEMLISISGGDKQDIRRMNKPQWQGTLYSRIVFAANELQGFNDTSRAMEMRLIVLNLTKSFAGQEDIGLTDKLLNELPGIMNRALTGLARLYARGGFKQPESGRARLQAQISKTDPNAGFINDVCLLDPHGVIPTRMLYSAYQDYAETMRLDNPLNQITFGRDLIPKYSIFSGQMTQTEARDLQARDPIRDNARYYKQGERVYRGIRLAPDWQSRLQTAPLSDGGYPTNSPSGMTANDDDIPF
jgi:putative DNA primase/helicase